MQPAACELGTQDAAAPQNRHDLVERAVQRDGVQVAREDESVVVCVVAEGLDEVGELFGGPDGAADAVADAAETCLAGQDLAEGRVGGPRQFQTYVLLANPDTATADVTVTFLRENGAAPVVKTYQVPGTSRFNVDLATVPELSNESFGVRIDVTNGVNIAVERSLYWNANGVFWAGGTNALATPLP